MLIGWGISWFSQDASVLHLTAPRLSWEDWPDCSYLRYGPETFFRCLNWNSCLWSLYATRYLWLLTENPHREKMGKGSGKRGGDTILQKEWFNPIGGGAGREGGARNEGQGVGSVTWALQHRHWTHRHSHTVDAGNNRLAKKTWYGCCQWGVLRSRDYIDSSW